MSAQTWSDATIMLGGVATIAIMTFLIKENPFYRFFEHVFIGIAAGLGTVLTFKLFFWPEVITPLFGLDIVVYPDGTTSGPYNPARLLLLLPLLFGSLYYTAYSKKFGWLAKLVVGFSLGMSGGIAFKSFFGEWIPQIANSFKPLIAFECVAENCSIDWWKSFEGVVFTFTMLSVMYYFFFSFQRRSAAGAFVSRGGRYLMMICFGAFFGSTVMARMALLVERVQFLVVKWGGPTLRLFGVEV